MALLGTFAYGMIFKDASGHNRPLSEAKEEQQPHIRSYGVDVQFIGTRWCITCLGVYFELGGNRVFCAHVNAWESSDPSREWELPTGGPDYRKMKNAFVQRLKAHSRKFGWGPSDVYRQSLILVSAQPGTCGYALEDGLKEFLGLAERPETMTQHGFIIAPGKKQRIQRAGREYKKAVCELLGFKQIFLFDDPDRPERLYDSLPNNFEERAYVDLDHPGKKVKAEFTYTGTIGWHGEMSQKRLEEAESAAKRE